MPETRPYIPQVRVAVPRVAFLSSTVHDLRTERDAIHGYLEDKGYKVLASDAPTFPVSDHEHSYKACIDNIEAADIVIVLIGYRYGGVLRVGNEEISITQMEFRQASRLGKRIIILSADGDSGRGQDFPGPP